MKWLFLAVIAFVFTSCQSGKAKEFEALLDSTEREIFLILSADSTESRRLQALIDKNPEIALQIGKTQADRLRAAINKVHQADISTIENAEALKRSSLEYYKGLLELKNVDILEAQLEAIHLKGKSEKSEQAITEIANLARSRLKIHRCLGEVEVNRSKARIMFEKANDLD
ncbi:hypothetical protein [Desertivirga arenae]|uniref:hypothetical protein n=1 Tax=Desertivirga arenae TaxID=2810309 RepID=UPI001A95DEC4|nr:hypothetical protein [Pedobacter sp. SYSU D00823]